MRTSLGYRVTMPRRARRSSWIVLVAIIISIPLFARRGLAQGIDTIGNRFVTAHVATGSGSGRFWITASQERGGYRFLYGNDFFISSNIVFRLGTAAGDFYYSNIPFDYPYRPTLQGGEEIPFQPFDDFYRSDDTLALTWLDLKGYDVTLRFIPEKQASEFDRGGDILIEFSYTASPLAPLATLGIFMMLDGYNSQAGGVDDASSLLTSDRYFPVGTGGALYPSGSDSIPAFYQMGDFRYDEGDGMVLPIHRLKGRSHNGVALVPPHVFAVGEWESMRDLYWGIDQAAVASAPIGNVATILRWEGLQGNGMVRTAFGLSDRDGNDLFYCHDSSLFFDLRAPRLVEQTTRGGAYLPAQFEVEMWGANLDVNDSARVTIRLDPIAAADGLALDAATPAEQTVTLPKGGTKLFRWHLAMTPGRQIARADIPLIFHYRLGDEAWRDFREICSPTVTVKGFKGAGEDTAAPVITLVGSGSEPRRFWRYRAFDRHAGYDDDSGIDTARVVVSRSYNVAIVPAAPIARCSVPADVELLATVLDTTRPARLVFALYDCRGNVAYDSASYIPPTTDTLPPVVEHVDSSKHSWTFRLSDRHGDYPYDTGIDTIVVEMDRSVNFTITGTAFKPCDTSMRVELITTVADTLSSALIVFRVIDCRGNVARDSARYRPSPSGVEEIPVTGAHGAFVAVRPQPVVRGGGRMVTITAGGIGREAHGELVSADGRVALRFAMEWRSPDGIASASIELPNDLPAGVYIVRAEGEKGRASERMVVVE